MDMSYQSNLLDLEKGDIHGVHGVWEITIGKKSTRRQTVHHEDLSRNLPVIWVHGVHLPSGKRSHSELENHHLKVR